MDGSVLASPRYTCPSSLKPLYLKAAVCTDFRICCKSASCVSETQVQLFGRMLTLSPSSCLHIHCWKQHSCLSPSFKPQQSLTTLGKVALHTKANIHSGISCVHHSQTVHIYYQYLLSTLTIWPYVISLSSWLIPIQGRSAIDTILFELVSADEIHHQPIVNSI